MHVWPPIQRLGLTLAAISPVEPLLLRGFHSWTFLYLSNPRGAVHQAYHSLGTRFLLGHQCRMNL